MGEERAAKLRKLNGFRRSLPSMSVSAFSSFLKEAQKGDLPSLTERKHVKEATLHALPDSIYGPMLVAAQLKAKQLPNKKPKEFEEVLLANPLTMLQAAYGQGGSFHKLVQDTLKSIPCSLGEAWNVLLYADEIQPGQTLGIHGGYASILEFGSIALSNELAWLPICAVPSNHVSGIEAGISQVFVKILQQFFLNPICNVGSGLRLKGKEAGDSCTLFLQLGGLLQDGQAQKLVYSSKGDGGSRLCIMCANLYSEKTDICGEDTVLKCQLIDEKDLILTSDKNKKTKVLTPCQILGHRFCLFVFFCFFWFYLEKPKKKVLTPCQIMGHRFCLFGFFSFSMFWILGHGFCHFGFFGFFGFSRFLIPLSRENKVICIARDGCTSDTGMYSSADGCIYGLCWPGNNEKSALPRCPVL